MESIAISCDKHNASALEPSRRGAELFHFPTDETLPLRLVLLEGIFG
jgi:hypothetical protein